MMTECPIFILATPEKTALQRTRNRFEVQHATRAACDALAAGDAPAVANRFVAPGIVPDVDPDRTIVRTNPTLHAARGIRHHPGT